MAFRDYWSTRFEINPGKWVYVPSQFGRDEGKLFLDSLVSKWHPPPFFFHLRPGGHLAALRLHQQRRYFASLDISNFFGSINRTRITRVLKPLLGYSKARKIAQSSVIAQYDSGGYCYRLPYGFVQSMFIASMCLADSAFGKALARQHKAGDISLSIYVDDIILSSDNLDHLRAIVDGLIPIAKRSGWILAEDKCQSPSTSVTAFNIELAYESMQLTADRLATFLSAYNCSTSDQERKGIASYVAAVNAKQAALFN